MSDYTSDDIYSSDGDVGEEYSDLSDDMSDIESDEEPQIEESASKLQLKKLLQQLDGVESDDTNLKPASTRKRKKSVYEQVLSAPQVTDDDDDLDAELEQFLKEASKLKTTDGAQNVFENTTENESLMHTANKITRTVVVEGITTELRKQSFQARVGTPTCSKRDSKNRYLAIGTSLGLLLLYEQDPISQTLRLKNILGSAFNRDSSKWLGEVTSVDFSFTGDLIAVGHESGKVQLWQTRNATLVKTIDDAFYSPVSYIVLAKTDSSSIAKIVIANEDGKLRVVSITKSLFRYSSSIYFDINFQNEMISDVKALCCQEDFGLVAILTTHTLYIYNFYSATPVMAAKPFPITNLFNDISPSDSPTMSWRVKQQKQTGEKQVSQLAIAFGRQINVYELSIPSKDVRVKIEEDISNLELGHSIIAVAWVSERVLIAIDQQGALTVVDPKVEEFVAEETKFQIDSHQPLPHLEAIDNELYIFTIDDSGPVVSHLRVVDWKERLDSFIRVGMWSEALKLADDFYHMGGKAVLGLPDDASAIREIISKKVEEMIVRYLDVTIAQRANVQETSSLAVYEMVGTTCIERAIRVGRTDLVFGIIFSHFKDKGAPFRNLFLDIVEKFILKNDILELPDGVLLEFISRTQNIPSKRNELDTCLTKLNLSKIGFDPMYEICKKSDLELFDTLCHIYAQLKNDYLQPLLEVYTYVVNNHPQRNRVVDILLKNARNYLTGQIPLTDVESIRSAKMDVLDFLFFPQTWGDDKVATDLKRVEQSEAFSFLVELRPKFIFQILGIVMSDQSPTSPWSDNSYQRQDVLNQIQEVMDEKEKRFKNKDDQELYYCRICFYEFYLQCIAHKQVEMADDATFYKMFSSLAADTLQTERKYQEEELEGFNDIKDYREDIIIKVLQLRGDTILSETTKLLEIVKENNLYAVSRFLFKLTKKWKQHVEVNFSRIFYRAQRGMISQEKQEMRNFSFEFVKDLGNEGAAHNYVISEVNSEIERLKAIQDRDPLDGFLIQRLRFFLYHYITNLLRGEDEDTAEETETEKNRLNMNIVQLLKKGVKIDGLIYTYLELLVIYEENKIIKEYLQQQSESFDVQRCLDICKDIPEAKSFLLERTGEVSHALKEIVKELERKINTMQEKFIAELRRDGTEITDPVFYDKVAANFNLITDDPDFNSSNFAIEDQQEKRKSNPKPVLPKVSPKDLDLSIPSKNLVDVIECYEMKELDRELRTAVNLCSQNSERKTLDDEEVQELWFRLLDTFLLLQRRLRYGYVHGKPLPAHLGGVVPASKPNLPPTRTTTRAPKPSDSSSDSESDDESDVDEYLSVQEEIVSVTNEMAKLEEEIGSERSKAIPDEAQIEKILLRLKKKREHSQALQLKLKELEENEKRLKQEIEEANNDPTAPHNIPKLVNIWLQRCISHSIRLIISHMTQYVDIPSVLNKMLNQHEHDRFGNISITLMRMLDLYGYERMLLNKANESISFDMFHLGAGLHDARTRAFKPRAMAYKIGGNVRQVDVSLDNLPENATASFITCLLREKIDDEKKLRKCFTANKMPKNLFAKQEAESTNDTTDRLTEAISLFERVTNVVDSYSVGLNVLKEIGEVNKKKEAENKADQMLEKLAQKSGIGQKSTLQQISSKVLNLAPPKPKRAIPLEPPNSPAQNTDSHDSPDLEPTIPKANRQRSRNVTHITVESVPVIRSRKVVDILDFNEILELL